MPMRRDSRSREIIGDRGSLRQQRSFREQRSYRERRVGPPRYRQNEYRREYRRYPRYWGPRYRPYYYDDGPTIYIAPRYVERRYYRDSYSSAHVEWCYDRYRSYRAYDNTYQPYNGPRRQCYSPYS